jgi:mono/diheme cytochrome c family protein
MHTLTPPLTCLRRVAAAAGLALLAAAIPAGAQERSQDQEGWRQYMVHCARCHGDDAIGGLMAPDLRSSMQRGAVDDQAFQDVVLHGRRERGMPGFKGVLTAEQVAAIQAYVAARASGKLKAGRPA